MGLMELCTYKYIIRGERAGTLTPRRWKPERPAAASAIFQLTARSLSPYNGVRPFLLLIPVPRDARPRSCVYGPLSTPVVLQKGLIPLNHHLNEFCRTTRELLASEQVRSMGRWKHHGHITTLRPLLCSWPIGPTVVARKFGWDEAAAARGGLLHDLYLYDSRGQVRPPRLAVL